MERYIVIRSASWYFDPKDVLVSAQAQAEEAFGEHVTVELDQLTLEHTTMICRFVVVDPLDEYSTREGV